MRLAIPSLLLLAFVALEAAKKKPVGKCEPYAEVCRHCTDCTQCAHCAVGKGFCSVCLKK